MLCGLFWLLALRELGLRLRAGRPRLVSARPHPRRRHPASCVNRTTFFDVEQILTEKIRNEFIGRGKYRVMPEAAGADAVLDAEITSITLSPVGFTDAAARVALSLHR